MSGCLTGAKVMQLTAPRIPYVRSTPRCRNEISAVRARNPRLLKGPSCGQSCRTACFRAPQALLGGNITLRSRGGGAEPQGLRPMTLDVHLF